MCLFELKKNIYTISIAKFREFSERNDKVVKPHCIYIYNIHICTYVAGVVRIEFLEGLKCFFF